MRKIFLILSLLFSVATIAQRPLIVNGWRHGAVGCGDADANAFITATGISGTDADAICDLVTDLKAASLWTKLSAIYPMIGGTATTHKYNLKDPDDDDASFRLAFSGTWVHSSNGALPDGSSAYANTFLNATAFGLNDIHLSYYSRTNTTTVGTDIGCYNGANTLTRIMMYFGAGVDLSSLNDFAFPTFAVTTTAIYEIISRINSTDFETYQNGVLKTRSAAAASSSIPNYNIYVGALNQANTAVEFTDRQCAFATIGVGLTGTEAGNLNTIIEAFNDALGRGVQ